MTTFTKNPFSPPDALAQNYLRKQELFGWLDRMGQELELSETRYLDAESKYQAVSVVLHGCPVLQPFAPQMFAQGSFALGTTVKPLHGDEHDLDFICLLPRAHYHRQSQRQIFDWVFQRLATHGTYQSMVEPKNRCVRIRYANEFHLDITPAVFNPFCSQQGLYVPDREVAAWQASHPKGYVEWFTPIAALEPRFRTLEKALENRHVTYSFTELRGKMWTCLVAQMGYYNTYIRVSVAYLFKIYVDGRYLLVRSRNVPGQFQPVGGVYKRLRDSVEKLNQLEVLDDKQIPICDTTRLDLRVRVKGKHLAAFIKWFESKEDREISHWREFCEELVQPKVLSSEVFPHVNYRFLHQNPYYLHYSEHYGCQEMLVHEVYELLPSPK